MKTLSLALLALPLLAQAAEPPQDPATAKAQKGMAQMKHGGMGHGMPAMAQGQKPHDMKKMDPGAMGHDMAAMDKNDKAPPPAGDSRDPNAYADGYTLDSGPYALPGPRQLHMGDEHQFAHLLLDQLEWRGQGDSAYDGQAWYGNSFDKAVLKAEGDWAKDKLEEARTELLWSHAVSGFWDAQLGARFDGGEGPERRWLALGFQGLAPYWFELDVTAYLGEQGRSALRLDADYELLLTQRLVLQPKIEANFYGKDDTERGIAKGLSDASAGIRLRYEFSRQFAPYVGFEWQGRFGKSASLARQEGQATREGRWLAGVRFWF
ncbi:copper resistance protein B [Gallaecimonas kandeliae]|uniref:copper resistance protein B n=1 Tax=Gallaecimonas kandeliae TaxID=3029055 RepID=UPI00264A1F9F|nr:copper resistance protein B [Gallaecimonas kandeliae]WKE65346.1 copper resistance protein B [Gallaecimonas kandeliae]